MTPSDDVPRPLTVDGPDEALFRAVDRLRVPLTDAACRATETALRAVAQRLYEGCAVEIARHGGDRDPVGFSITAKDAPDLETLLERAGGAIEGTG